MTREELEALIRAAQLFLRPELIRGCIPAPASEDDEDDGTSASSSDTEASSPAPQSDENDETSAEFSDTKASSPASGGDETSAASSSTTQNYADFLKQDIVVIHGDDESDDEYHDPYDGKILVSVSLEKPDPYRLLTPKKIEDTRFILEKITEFINRCEEVNEIIMTEPQDEEAKARLPTNYEIENAQTSDYLGLVKTILSYKAKK